MKISGIPEDKIGPILQAVNTVIHPRDAHTTYLAAKLSTPEDIISDADLFSWLCRLVGVGFLEEQAWGNHKCPNIPAHNGVNFNTCWYRLTDEGKKALRAWIKRQDEADAEQDAA